MDVGKAFTYQTEDSEWVTKLILGAVITFIPVVNLAWAGYITAIQRNVVARNPQPLPRWDNFGKFFTDGLIVSISHIIYALPGVFLFFVPFFFLILPAFAKDSRTQAILGTIGGGIGLLLFGLMLIYLLAFSFLLPAIQLNFARYGTFGSCFQLGQILSIATANLGDYVIAWIVSIGAFVVVFGVLGFVISALNFIPCLGTIISLLFIPVSFFVSAWLTTTYAHLFGQVGQVTYGAVATA